MYADFCLIQYLFIQVVVVCYERILQSERSRPGVHLPHREHYLYLSETYCLSTPHRLRRSVLEAEIQIDVF